MKQNATRAVCLYRAIPTNLDEHGWSCSEVVHRYSQRGGTLENKSEELCSGFAER